MAELHARLDAMAKRLTALNQAMQAIEQLPSQDSLQKSLDTAKEHIHEFNLQITELRADLDEKNLPKLTLLQTSDAPAKN